VQGRKLIIRGIKMTTGKRIDPDNIKDFLKLREKEIIKIIANIPKKGTWTLLITVREEFAIKTTKNQFCPKGQDEIKNPHYEFCYKPQKVDLEKLLETSEWPKEVYKKLVAGIKEEIDKGSWY